MISDACLTAEKLARSLLHAEAERQRRAELNAADK